MRMPDIEIQYTFQQNENSDEYLLCFDEVSFDLKSTSADTTNEPPEWTQLGFNQCANCPLNKDEVPHCPLSVELYHVMSNLGDKISYEEVHVEVKTPQRVYSKNTTMQEGMSSIIGLMMSTSGCPHTNYFKPMARFHLPFATAEETLVRSIQMFLLARYLEHCHSDGASVEIGLEGLEEIYKQIHKVNIGIARRLQAVVEQDSTVNAVVLLDMFSGQFRFNLEESLENLKVLYKPFLQSNP